MMVFIIYTLNNLVDTIVTKSLTIYWNDTCCGKGINKCIDTYNPYRFRLYGMIPNETKIRQ